MPKEIFVLHENPAWLPPFERAFARRGLSFQDWNLVERAVDLSKPPPEGIFFNRMSASSHTRGHRFSPELTGVVLAWLEGHGRRVINSSRALQLEVSKSAQLAALQACGVPVPRTIAAVGQAQLLGAVNAFAPAPVIVKPNRGGKGLGVRLFEDLGTLRELILQDALDPPVDGITLVQQYIRPAGNTITRAEFIGGKFHYAVEIDTTMGFELCPAEVCSVDGSLPAPQFTIIDEIDDGLKAGIEQFLALNGIEMAGVEFATDANANFYVYDVNTNTNYNPEAEAVAGKNAAQATIDFLIGELNRTSGRLAA
jgi:glutathione synthase/RimK-type ligase-like ATP-grasp enzyme